MGNNQSSSLPSIFLECLLSEDEFLSLKVGDKFDHRDTFGQYAIATIKQKKSNNSNEVYIKYKGWGNKWNVWCNYKKDPYSFAKHRSISRRHSNKSSQFHIGTVVQFRGSINNNSKWNKAIIIQKDNNSGQVKVQYGKYNKKSKWTHLDNEYEICSVNNTTHQSSHNNYSSHKNHSSYNNHSSRAHKNYNAHNYNNNNQYQIQQQSQMQRQDQMTVRTQLLLDDTQNLLIMTKDYLDHFNNNDCNKQDLSLYNQKVIASLTLFKMKVDAMRKNGMKENITFNDAFKSSSMLIKKFEINYKKEFGSNKLLMKRLNPCLNYMRAVLNNSNNIPALPYINEYKFDKNIASNVISGVAHSMNHVIPDRIKDISNNNNLYKLNQQQLKQQYDNQQYNDTVNDINYNNLIQDFNGNIAFPLSKQQQNDMIKNDQQQYAFQAPDLQNMDLDNNNY